MKINKIWTCITDIYTTNICGRDFFVFFTKEKNSLLVPCDGSITRISHETLSHSKPTYKKPWGKYIEYITIGGLNFVVHIENRTVDIVPLAGDSCDADMIFLIKRKDKNGDTGGIALPGGHIDPPETPKEAAYRELGEEIFGVESAEPFVYFLDYLDGNWINEEVALGKTPAEHKSITLPFVAHIKKDAIDKVKASDDAEDGKWYHKDNIPYDQFHFLHHIDIVKSVFGDPIHKKGDKWYFWDEVWIDEIGPFDTRKQCEENTQLYADSLDDLSVKFPNVFLKNPTEGLDLKDDPNAKPIEDFMPEDEKQEWKDYVKELEEPGWWEQQGKIT